MIIIAKTIRGITVKLEANTTGLSKALEDVNKKARDIQSELRQVERLLKFDPKNTELLAQKQKLLSEQVENTREKLNRLKMAQEQVNEQFQKGDITEGQYRAFQRELVKTENQLKYFESQLKSSISVSERFAKRMQEAGEKLQSAGKKMTDIGKNLSMKVTAPIVAMGAALTGLATKTAEAGDQIQKMALRTGFSTEALSELKHAAELSGTSLEGLENGVRRMQRSVLDLERGLATQTEAFAKLGLEIEDLQGLSPEQQFNKITMALADVEDATTKAALAQQIFGRQGTQLLPMLDAGSEGIAEMRAEAHELGIVFDQEAADAAAQFNDDIDRLKKGFAGVFQELGKKLIPIFVDDLIPALRENLIPLMQSLADKISNLIKWFSNLSPRMQKIIIAATGLAVALGPVLIVVGKITSAVGVLLPILSKLTLAFSGISVPVLAAVAGVAAFAAIAIEVYRNWEETKKALISTWDLIKASTKQLGINVAISFEEMKAATLNAVNAMLEKLGVLENLPFGIGEKFKGLKDNISNSADASAAKIAELKKAAEENGERVSAAVEGTKVSFRDMGTAIANDVKGVIASIKGQTKAMAKGKKSTDDTTESFVDLGISASDAGDSVSYLNTNLDETEETTRSVTDIIDEMQAKLQQLNDEYVVFGDEIDINSRKARIYKNAIVELIKELGPNHEKVQELVEVYKELTKEEEKVIESTFDTAEALAEMEKSLDIVENKSVAFGDSFDVNSEKARILQNTISTLIENGIDPTSEKVRELVERYNELAESSEEVEESTFSLENELKNYNVQLDILRNKNKVFGDSFDFAKEKADLLKSTINTLIENGVNPAAPEIAKLKAEIDNLDNSLKDIDTQTVTSTSAFGLFKDNVINYMNELKNNTEQASKSAASAIVSFADSVVSGEKTLKEALKEMILNIITALEQQVIAQQIAGVAIAWAQAPVTFGASLAWIPQIAAAVAPALATFEAVKAVIRGLATGGIVTGPTLALIGEGKDDEAVLPLNKNTLSVLGQAIAANMPQQQVVAQRPIEVKLQIGTLVADELGLKKLERKLQSIRIQENLRLGGSQA